MSRHRGAKPSRRCGLLGKISLLSPEYLLSVERRPYHSEPPDHVEPGFPSARLVGLAVKPAYALALKRMVADHPEQTLRAPPLHFRSDRPSQTTHLTRSSRRITVAS